MEVELHCQGCGKLIRAPREAWGRWAQCPSCGRKLYVPTPSAELEELPLAPEDTAFLQREAALLEERRRLDRVVRREGAAPEGEGRRSPAREPDNFNVQAAIVEYLRALSRSDLDSMERLLPGLRRQRGEALAIINRFAADQMTPSALGNIPPGVFQGFLKHLRGQING